MVFHRGIHKTASKGNEIAMLLDLPQAGIIVLLPELPVFVIRIELPGSLKPRKNGAGIHNIHSLRLSAGFSLIVFFIIVDV